MKRNSVYSKTDLTKMSEEELSRRLILTLMSIVGIIILVTASLLFFAPKIGSFFGLFSVHRNDKDTLPQIKPNPPIFTNVPNAVKGTKVTLNGFGQGGATVIVYLNGPEAGRTVIGNDGFFNFTDLPLINGSNSFFAKIVDQNGAESEPTQTYTINVDNTPPEIDISNLKDKDVVKNLDKRITIDGKVNEKSTITINDKQVILRPDLTFEYLMGVSEGKVSIKIVATDEAGNEAKKEFTVTYQKRSS